MRILKHFSCCLSGHLQAGNRRPADQRQGAAVLWGWLLAQCTGGEHQGAGARGGGEEEGGEQYLQWEHGCQWSKNFHVNIIIMFHSRSLTLTLKHSQATKGDSKNAKKKNNKKTSKNKSSLSRANKKKPGMPNVSNDLSQKLYATMEKHKEVCKANLIIAIAA